MAFSQLINKGAKSVTKFFGSTLPSHAKKAHQFFGSTIAPNARRLHSAVKAGVESLEKDETLSAEAKQKISNIGRFSDLGLQKLNTFEKTANSVARAL